MGGRHRRDDNVDSTSGAFPWVSIPVNESRRGRRRRNRYSAADNTPEAGLTTGVMFICTGNIVRSAYAELKSGQLTQHPKAFASRGISAVRGRDLHPNMKKHMINAPSHVAQQATAKALRQSSLILVMERTHLEWVAEEAPDVAGRAFLLTHVAAGLDHTPPAAPLPPLELASYLKAIHVKMPAQTDIDDPIHGSGEDFNRCAAQLDGLLHSTLPWLRLDAWS